MTEKRAHGEDIFATATAHAARADEIAAGAAPYAQWGHEIRPQDGPVTPDSR